jgi:hypothetical protein
VLAEKPALLQPLGIFLEALEPHILADRLPCLAPEVVYALVNYFAVPGPDGRPAQPQRVERCVLHLDVFHLDLDQVGAAHIVLYSTVLMITFSISIVFHGTLWRVYGAKQTDRAKFAFTPCQEGIS